MKLPARLRFSATTWMLLAAIAFGLLALFGARGYISNELAAERERLRPHDDTVPVIVAKRNLVKGDPVNGTTMAVRQIPRQYVAGSAIRPTNFDQHVGSRLIGNLRSGEPLLMSSLYQADASTFSSQIRSGIRAMTVAVDEINSISGMLQPGDRIDLMLSTKAPARGGRDAAASDITIPLMQDVLVMATGKQVRPAQDAGSAARTFNTVTIEAEPTQAQRLIVAQRSGRLTAVLRNPDDRARIGKNVMDISSVLGVPRPPAGPPRPVTEVIVGGRGAVERRLQPDVPVIQTTTSRRTEDGGASAVVPSAAPGRETERESSRESSREPSRDVERTQ